MGAVIIETLHAFCSLQQKSVLGEKRKPKEVNRKKKYLASGFASIQCNLASDFC